MEEETEESTLSKNTLAKLLSTATEETGIESGMLGSNLLSLKCLIIIFLLAENLPEPFVNTMANTRVESLSQAQEALEPTALREYCENRFKFKIAQLLRFP